MSYKSIDTLQKVLSEEVFAHTKDSKKAAGRALGTLIEIITYYLLKEWNLQEAISIERKLSEYGNSSITHNVEFTLHPIFKSETTTIRHCGKISSKDIAKLYNIESDFSIKNNDVIDKNKTLKNSCIIAENEKTSIISNVDCFSDYEASITSTWQHTKPYAMIECKRVGVEEGSKKGPQTIEKAKQGAYVAQTTSSLQKIRNDKGEKYGILYFNGEAIIKPYSQFLEEIISKENSEILKDFTLSIGIVSNHGNWFTSDNQNKELKVLAQSYDWLLFLTDEGLAQFITDLLLSPNKKYEVVKEAFNSSYSENKKKNVFTKVKMNYDAHKALSSYFDDNISIIEKWFNIISPENRTISDLKKDLFVLSEKNWRNIL